MPLPETIYGQYQTGTVAVTSGSAVITGTGTVWNGQKVGATVVNVGDLFTIDDSRFYFIKSVDSATKITLDKPYAGSTASGQQYRIVYLAAAHFPTDTATKVARTIERYERLSDTAESALQANNLVAGTGINLSTNVGNGNVTIASNCVIKSGDTMTGPLRSSQWNPLIIESVNASGKRIQGVDTNGNNMGFFNFVKNDDGSTLVGMSTYHSDPNGVQKWSSIQAKVLADGTATTYAPTVSTTSNSDEIATTKWVNNKLNNVVTTNQSGFMTTDIARQFNDVDVTQPPSENKWKSSFYFVDKNGKKMAMMQYAQYTNGDNLLRLFPTKKDGSQGRVLTLTEFFDGTSRISYDGKLIPTLFNESVNSICFSNGTQICIGYADLSTSAKTMNFARAFEDSNTVRVVISRSGGNDFAQACVVSVSNTGFTARSDSSTAKRFAYIAIGKGA